MAESTTIEGQIAGLERQLKALNKVSSTTINIKIGRSNNTLESFNSKVRESVEMLRELGKQDVTTGVAAQAKKTFDDMKKVVHEIVVETKTLVDHIASISTTATRAKAAASAPTSAAGRANTSTGAPVTVSNIPGADKAGVAAQQEAIRNTKTFTEILTRNRDIMKSSSDRAKTWTDWLRVVANVTRDVHNETNKSVPVLARLAQIMVAAYRITPGKSIFTTLGESINAMSGNLINLIYWQARWYASKTLIFGVVSGFKESVKTFIEFEQQLKNIQSISNATLTDISKLSEVILQVAGATRFGITEIGGVAITLAQVGYTTKDIIQSLPAIANLATATLSDLNTTANLITTSMRSFNIAFEETGKVADIFANAVSNSRLTIEGIGVAFNYIGPVAEQVGLTLADTTSIMGLLSNKGIQFSTIGTSLRTLLGSLTAPTERFAKALGRVGLSVEDVNPTMRNFEDILADLKKSGLSIGDIFGGLDRRAAGTLAALIQSGADSFMEMRNGIEATGAASRKAEIQLTGIQQIIENLKQNIERLYVTIIQKSAFGKTLTDALETVRTTLAAFLDDLDKAPGKLDELVSRIENIASTVLKTIGTIAIFGAVGPLFAKAVPAIFAGWRTVVGPAMKTAAAAAGMQAGVAAGTATAAATVAPAVVGAKLTGLATGRAYASAFVKAVLPILSLGLTGPIGALVGNIVAGILAYAAVSLAGSKLSSLFTDVAKRSTRDISVAIGEELSKEAKLQQVRVQAQLAQAQLAKGTGDERRIRTEIVKLARENAEILNDMGIKTEFLSDVRFPNLQSLPNTLNSFVEQLDKAINKSNIASRILANIRAADRFGKGPTEDAKEYVNKFMAAAGSAFGANPALLFDALTGGLAQGLKSEATYTTTMEAIKTLSVRLSKAGSENLVIPMSLFLSPESWLKVQEQIETYSKGKRTTVTIEASTAPDTRRFMSPEARDILLRRETEALSGKADNIFADLARKIAKGELDVITALATANTRMANARVESLVVLAGSLEGFKETFTGANAAIVGAAFDEDTMRKITAEQMPAFFKAVQGAYEKEITKLTRFISSTSSNLESSVEGLFPKFEIKGSTLGASSVLGKIDRDSKEVTDTIEKLRATIGRYDSALKLLSTTKLKDAEAVVEKLRTSLPAQITGESEEDFAARQEAYNTELKNAAKIVGDLNLEVGQTEESLKAARVELGLFEKTNSKIASGKALWEAYGDSLVNAFALWNSSFAGAAKSAESMKTNTLIVFAETLAGVDSLVKGQRTFSTLKVPQQSIIARLLGYASIDTLLADEANAITRLKANSDEFVEITEKAQEKLVFTQTEDDGIAGYLKSLGANVGISIFKAGLSISESIGAFKKQQDLAVKKLESQVAFAEQKVDIQFNIKTAFDFLKKQTDLFTQKNKLKLDIDIAAVETGNIEAQITHLQGLVNDSLNLALKKDSNGEIVDPTILRIVEEVTAQGKEQGLTEQAINQILIDRIAVHDAHLKKSVEQLAFEKAALSLAKEKKDALDSQLEGTRALLDELNKQRAVLEQLYTIDERRAQALEDRLLLLGKEREQALQIAEFTRSNVPVVALKERAQLNPALPQEAAIQLQQLGYEQDKLRLQQLLNMERARALTTEKEFLEASLDTLESRGFYLLQLEAQRAAIIKNNQLTEKEREAALAELDFRKAKMLEVLRIEEELIDARKQLATGGDAKELEARIRLLEQRLAAEKDLATTSLKGNADQQRDLKKTNAELMTQIRLQERLQQILEGTGSLSNVLAKGVSGYLAGLKNLVDTMADSLTSLLNGLTNQFTKMLDDMLFANQEHNAQIKAERNQSLAEEQQGHEKSLSDLRMKLLLGEVDEAKHQVALVELNAQSAKERADIEKKYEDEKKGGWADSREEFKKYIREWLRELTAAIMKAIILELTLKAIRGYSEGGQTVQMTQVAGYNPTGAAGGIVTRNDIIPKYASGGAINTEAGGILSGGVPNKDSILAWTMPGEYVVRKSAVDAYGADFFHRINAERVDPRKLPRYAEGGMVTKEAASGSSSKDREPTQPKGDVVIYNFIDPRSLPRQPTSEDIVNVIQLDAMQNGKGIQTIRERIRG